MEWRIIMFFTQNDNDAFNEAFCSMTNIQSKITLADYLDNRTSYQMIFNLPTINILDSLVMQSAGNIAGRGIVEDSKLLSLLLFKHTQIVEDGYKIVDADAKPIKHITAITNKTFTSTVAAFAKILESYDMSVRKSLYSLEYFNKLLAHIKLYAETHNIREAVANASSGKKYEWGKYENYHTGYICLKILITQVLVSDTPYSATMVAGMINSYEKTGALQMKYDRATYSGTDTVSFSSYDSKLGCDVPNKFTLPNIFTRLLNGEQPHELPIADIIALQKCVEQITDQMLNLMASYDGTADYMSAMYS